jgi:cell division protein FtsL
VSEVQKIILTTILIGALVVAVLFISLIVAGVEF